MFSFLEARGAGRGGLHRPSRRTLRGPTRRSTSPSHRPGPTPASGTPLEESIDVVAHALARDGAPQGDDPFALPLGAPLPVVVRMRQVHGAGVHTVDRTWLEGRQAEPPEVRRSGDRHAGRGPAGPGRRLRPGAPRRRRPPVSSGSRTRGGRGWRRGGPRRGAADARPGGREAHRLGRAARVRPLLRGARRRCARRSPRVVPESYAETSWGTPALDVGAGVVAQLRAEGAEVVDAARCTLEDDACTPTAETAPRQAGSAAWSGCGHDRRRAPP